MLIFYLIHFYFSFFMARTLARMTRMARNLARMTRMARTVTRMTRWLAH